MRIEQSRRSVRAGVHRALGDERRLQIVDALQASDYTPGELAAITGLSTNLLAFHLGVLEAAGLVVRTESSGDARRRYVTLAMDPWGTLRAEATVPSERVETVLFVCTANAARSQLAAQVWHERTQLP